MLIFRVHEQGEVQPNYNVAILKGNTFPHFISLLNIRLSLKLRICRVEQKLQSSLAIPAFPDRWQSQGNDP